LHNGLLLANYDGKRNFCRFLRAVSAVWAGQNVQIKVDRRKRSCSRKSFKKV
jgi:hypothetical protein